VYKIFQIKEYHNHTDNIVLNIIFKSIINLIKFNTYVFKDIFGVKLKINV
jgi:hypothetical protein